MLNNKTYSNRRYMRIMMVIVVYTYELFNKKVNEKEIFESDLMNEMFDYNVLTTSKRNEIFQQQMKIFANIEKNYEVFVKMINKFIRLD